MPRPKTILQSEYPYHITARCINQEWFQIPIDRVWKILCEEATRTTKELHLQIHSFVLMSNHFHLIASTPQSNISQCMHQFMSRSSRRLTKEGNRINQTFSGRHYKCILHCQNYYLNAYKYNYRNPVTAGICDLVQQYPYSTLHGLTRQSDLMIPLCEDSTFISNPKGTLDWLNTPPDLLKLEGVRYGLKHQFFKSKKSTKDNKPLILDTDTL
jgi:REP element-mobilizing transposase RayT